METKTSREGVNKFILMTILTVILIGSGIIYQTYFRAPEIAPIKATGKITEVNIRILQDKWEWNPDIITVKAGDTVRLIIFNEDTYDHGFALETFGVNRRLFPKKETIIEFVASKIGDHPFFCSVPCGEGHYSQTGHFIVEE